MTMKRALKYTGLSRATVRTVLGSLLLAVCLLSGTDVLALGTPAGTVITNTATVTYTISGSSYVQSGSASLQVAERLELALIWQDAAPVMVAPGQTNAVTTFRISNTGNGSDAYTLTATGTAIGGDQFDPAVTAIYLDADGNSAFDAGTDILYTSGTGTLAADAFHTVFVLSTIPATTLNAGDIGAVQLVATSAAGTGAAGTILPGAGEGGVDAVIGASQGTGTATGRYAITSPTAVNVAKTAVVSDPYGGSRPQPGAVIQYTLTVTASGPGTANNTVIADAIPQNTAYRAGTLRLNGSLLSDGPDADAGDVGATTPNAVTVTLGSLTSASPAQVVTFEVIIN
jgi:uncharacterized repeat protein (TIGR01451 family)